MTLSHLSGDYSPLNLTLDSDCQAVAVCISASLNKGLTGRIENRYRRLFTRCGDITFLLKLSAQPSLPKRNQNEDADMDQPTRTVRTDSCALAANADYF